MRETDTEITKKDKEETQTENGEVCIEETANSEDEIKENNYVLTPGRYVGTEKIKEDGIPFEEKMKELTEDLLQQMEESVKLDEEIKKILNELKF